MKKILIAVLLWGSSAVQGQAQAIPFNYTGSTSVNLDFEWFQSFNTNYHGQPWGGGFGGPPGEDLGGQAEQFTLSEPTNISALDVTITVPSDQYMVGSGSFTYNLYTGTTYMHRGDITNYPNLAGLPALTSDLITFTAKDEFQTINEQVPFNINLSAGTYWLSQEGFSYPFITVSQQYIDPPSSQATVPEPSSVWLLLTGLLSGVYRRITIFAKASGVIAESP